MQNRKDNFIHWILVAVLVLWSVTVLYPFLWLIINSLRKSKDILASPWGFPNAVMLQNYKILLYNPEFFIYFKNTFLVTAISLILLITLVSLTSFAVARLKFRGNALVYGLIIVGILLPGNASIVPLFMIMKNMHFLNTIYSLPLPYTAASIPEAVFILVAFMRSIPSEIEESCIMDGAKLFDIYARIIFPLSIPGIITIAIFNGLGFWNEFLYPLLFTSTLASRTLSIGIRMFVGKRQTDFGAVFAGITISIIPTIIFYSLVSEKITKGMVLGAVKG